MTIITKFMVFNKRLSTAISLDLAKSSQRLATDIIALILDKANNNIEQEYSTKAQVEQALPVGQYAVEVHEDAQGQLQIKRIFIKLTDKTIKAFTL